MNKRHAFGKYEMTDGKCYEGEYNHGKKSGHGVYTWSNGDKYEGQWACDLQHGIGFMQEVGEDGRVVIKRGEWVEGKIVRWIEDQAIFDRQSTANE